MNTKFLKKLSLCIFVALIFSSFAEAKIIHLKCEFKKNTFIWPHKKIEDNEKQYTIIWSIDLDKRKILDTNYQNNKPVNAIINKNEIIWFLGGTREGEDKKKHRHLKLENSDIWVNQTRIDRYKGDAKITFYEMKRESFSHIWDGKTRLKNVPVTKWLEGINKLIKEEEDENFFDMQKKFVTAMFSEGECTKVKKEQKF